MTPMRERISHWFVDSRTGDKILEVRAAGDRRTTRMNESGMQSMGLLPGDARYRRVSDATWAHATEPLKRTVVTCLDGVPIHAGLILQSAEDVSQDQFALTTIELRWIAAHRYVRGVADYGNGVFRIEGKNAYGLANEVMRRGFVGDDSLVRWEMPVSIPAGAAGGRSMSFHPHDFVTIEDILQQMQSIAGYDVHLTPRWVPSDPDRFEWAALVGTPLIAGSVLEWDLTAKSPVTSTVLTIDGSDTAGGVFVQGKGSGKAMRVGKAATPLVADDPPAVYRVVQEKDLATQSILDDIAAQEVAATARPTKQWELKVTLPEDDPATALALHRPGTRINAYVKSRLDGERWRSFYVIGASSSMTDEVTLEVQEVSP